MLAVSLEEFIAARADVWLWLMAVGAIAFLAFGADRAVSAAVRLATALGMSKVIIGATVVSLGTTSPETFVSVTAAFSGKPGLALGNGVGSVICNMALIFGVCCTLVSLPKDRFILRRHGWLQLGSAALLAVSAYGLAFLGGGGIGGTYIPRWLGVGFLVLLTGYMYASVRWAKSHPEALPAGEMENPDGKSPVLQALGGLLRLVLGLGLVIVSAKVMVGSVSELCVRYRVPPNVLAVTLVAFGTSLPELATGIASILKGHPELLVGNIVGANILNVLFVVGASATAVPLLVPPEFFYLHFPVMLCALVLFRLYSLGHVERFRRWQGIPLLLLFGGYYATLLLLVGMGVLKYE